MSSTPLAVEVQEQETNAAGPKNIPFSCTARKQLISMI